MAASETPRIGPAEGQALIEQGWQYLDVRTEAEYAAGHPAGGHNVPLMSSAPGGMRPNDDFLRVVLAIYPKDAKLVVGCQSGKRSAVACEKLRAAGYTELRDLRTGFGGVRDAFGQVQEPGWQAAGLPVETITAGASYAELRARAGL
jgi:rhodanese-related sulfurtransferase